MVWNCQTREHKYKWGKKYLTLSDPKGLTQYLADADTQFLEVFKLCYDLFGVASVSAGDKKAEMSTGLHSVAFNKPLTDSLKGCVPVKKHASCLLWTSKLCQSHE